MPTLPTSIDPNTRTIAEHDSDHETVHAVNNVIAAKGDVPIGSGATAWSKVAALGVNGNVLTEDTATATGWKSAPAAGGGVSYGTTTELADVAAVEAAGVSALVSRADHTHYHGTGYLPNAHHAQAHADTDHTGPNKVDVSVAGALIGTRSKINFVSGATGVDNAGAGRVDVTITGGGAAIPQVIALGANSIMDTDQPATQREFNAATGRRAQVDLTNATQFRVSVRVTAAGATNARLGVEYSTTEGGTYAWLDGTVSGTTPANGYAALNNVGCIVSAWTNLVAGAKADVFVRPATINGDGVADPVIFLITLQVR